MPKGQWATRIRGRIVKVEERAVICILTVARWEYFCERGYAPRRQNVSIGLRVGDYDVDVVPGRRQDQWSGDHSLYRQKVDTWTQTNVEKHIRDVRQSCRLEEIKVIKIWRNQHQLDFPSFYLELLTIHACSGKRIGNLADNVFATLAFVRDNILTAYFVDPANTNNRISDDLSLEGKQALHAAAANACSATNWNQIVQ